MYRRNKTRGVNFVKKIKYMQKLSTVEIPEKLICDVCKKEFEYDDYQNIQEFVHLHFFGGYGSVFGDGDEFELDICQHCLKEKLGEFIRNI